MNIHTLTTSLVDKYSLCMGLHFLCVCYFLILPQKWRFFVTQTTCTRDRKNLHKNSVDRISYLKFCRLTQLKYPPQLYIDFWLYICYCKKYYHALGFRWGVNEYNVIYFAWRIKLTNKICTNLSYLW